MRVERFSFREFDAGVASANAPATALKPLLPGGRRRDGGGPPPPPATFSEEQLKAAERDSYKKGFLEGTEEGRKQAESEQAALDRKLAESVQKFAHCLTPLLDDYKQMITQMKQDLPKVGLCIAKKVAGDALAQNPQAAVEEIAARCVETMIGEPKLVITVHPSLVTPLEKKLRSVAERMESATALSVAGDEKMDAADCRVEWKYGAMERHTGQLWEQIEQAVGRMAAGAAYAAEAQVKEVQEKVENPPPIPATNEQPESPTKE